MGLALTRKLGESIEIGDNITVTVVELERGRCKLVVEAPRDVRVIRSELVQQAPREGLPGYGQHLREIVDRGRDRKRRKRA
jgi:carbon storage regulator